ncbi:MAG TPA: hypothetical protein VMT55_03815 [Candidatus Sulfotelmatobacter sp.]|nr:hypothetical protein [Candidatus Sulfotelmatobacter sp.]
MLVSGRFHEFSAPFLAALQAGEDVGPKVVSFDRHQDCHSNRFVAGGFWRWLIDQKRLKGNDLIMVGAAGRPILSLFREFLRDEVIAQAIEYYSSTKCDVFDFGPAAEEAAAAVAKRSRYRVRGPITPDGWQALQQRIRSDDQQAIAGLYALVTERKWVEDSGIRLVNDPEKAEQVSQLPAKGEKMFVSFDGDVCERPSVQLPGPMVWRSPIFTDRTVYGIFDLLRSARLFGLHVSELESPLCQLEPGELAQAMMG